MNTYSINRDLGDTEGRSPNQVKAVLSRVRRWWLPPKKIRVAFPSFMALGIVLLNHL